MNYDMAEKSWIPVDHISKLDINESAIWQFNPKGFTQYSRFLERYLSVEETKRLSRFVNEDAGQEFVLCRGILRFILAGLTGQSPEKLNIQSGEQGKPELLDKHQVYSISFNISHTRNLCLIAFGRNCEVGVDVEHLHFIQESARLAQIYLSPEELSMWQKVERKRRSAKFIEYWCAKEAVLKAAGCGLTIHPSQVNTLEALAGQVVRGMREDGCFFEFRDCWLKKLPLPSEYCGWFAILGKPVNIHLYQFKPHLLDEAHSSDGIKVEK